MRILIAVRVHVDVGAAGEEIAVHAVCERNADAPLIQLLQDAGRTAAGGVVQEVVVLELVAHGGGAGLAHGSSGAGQEAGDLDSIDEAGDSGYFEGA